VEEPQCLSSGVSSGCRPNVKRARAVFVRTSQVPTKRPGKKKGRAFNTPLSCNAVRDRGGRSHSPIQIEGKPGGNCSYLQPPTLVRRSHTIRITTPLAFSDRTAGPRYLLQQHSNKRQRFCSHSPERSSPTSAGRYKPGINSSPAPSRQDRNAGVQETESHVWRLIPVTRH